MVVPFKGTLEGKCGRPGLLMGVPVPAHDAGAAAEGFASSRKNALLLSLIGILALIVIRDIVRDFRDIGSGNFDTTPANDTGSASAILESMETINSRGTASKPLPGLSEILSNYDEYHQAPYVKNTPVGKKQNQIEPKVLRKYERLYEKQPVKSVVPIVKPDVNLTKRHFHQLFRRPGIPFKFSFENIRHLGFPMRAKTIAELREMFPFHGEVSKVFRQYVPNIPYSGQGEIDLGPGLKAIENDGKLIRQSGLRNFPRNMRVRSEHVEKLGVVPPPLIDPRGFKLPSLWMGTSSSGTKLHLDCCDNFVMMIAGTKRFRLVPPTAFYELQTKCFPNLFCKARKQNKTSPDDPWDEIFVDVNPGEILYLPSSWFHDVENVGPTVMVNVWTKGPQTCGISDPN